jgi:uncharacterized protein (DUF934 family)
MPLLESGRIVSDPWQKLADDAPLPSGPCILSLSRLQQNEALRMTPHPRLGVALPVDQPEEVLASYLDRLSLVAVNFPTFRDGRGFTQARNLRERLAFSGEIRATGNILPDQYAFLLRCGITTVEIQDGADPAAWQKAADRFSFAYQPSVLKEPILSGLRRAMRVGVEGGATERQQPQARARDTEEGPLISLRVRP